MRNWLTHLKGLRRYPALAAGLVLLTIMVVVSIYTVIAIPYSEAVRLWQGGPGVWDDNPRLAKPVWWQWFTRDRLPSTIIVTSEEGDVNVETLEDDRILVEIVLPFYFDYGAYPNELIVSTRVSGVEGRMPISVFWQAPGREMMTLQEGRLIRAADVYRISQDTDLTARLGAPPHRGLLTGPDGDRRPLAGDYRLLVRAELPQDAEMTARLVVYGQIEGLFGTDHRRRDLGVALLWGTPIALIFGVLAAIGAQVSTFVLGAIGTWYGGKLDAVFHRLVELTMILPMLPILIVVGHLYSRSIWVMLGLVIALNIFSGSMKTYRAMFLQAKEAPYFEAARAYGTGNMRMVFRYLMPRLAPILLPQ